MAFWRFSQQTQEWRDEAREHIGNGAALRAGLVIAVLYALLTIALGIFWSREPALVSADTVMARQLPKVPKPAPGSNTAAALSEVVTTLFDKSGGFIGNDIAPPGLWLDNMPSWERGVLVQARDVARALRETWGRENAEANEDIDLGRVEPRLNFSERSWVLPSSESQYREAVQHLRSYLQRLQQAEGLQTETQRALFAATATNLNGWLLQVSTRLDDLSQRLSAGVKSPGNSEFGSASGRPLTPSAKIDDVFFEARGSAWALIHLLRAAEIDFADVLRQHNAQAALHQIIRDLEATQETVYSPLILNGGGFGMLANHSLVMASYMARADAAVATVRRLLAEPIPAQNTDSTNSETDRTGEAVDSSSE